MESRRDCRAQSDVQSDVTGILHACLQMPGNSDMICKGSRPQPAARSCVNPLPCFREDREALCKAMSVREPYHQNNLQEACVQGPRSAPRGKITAVTAHPGKTWFVTTADDGWLRVWAQQQHHAHALALGQPVQNSHEDAHNDSWAHKESRHRGASRDLRCDQEIELTGADGWRKHALCLTFSPPGARVRVRHTRRRAGRCLLSRLLS